MKIEIRIDDCEIIIDDNNSAEPSSSRWPDQHERMKDMLREATASCIDLYKTKDTERES